MLGPCRRNGKRYSGAYFTEPVRPTHAPLKALRNFISSPPVFTAATELTMTKLANLECLDASSVSKNLSLSLFRNAIKARDSNYGVSLKVGATITPSGHTFT